MNEAISPLELSRGNYKIICAPHHKELSLPFYISTFGKTNYENKICFKKHDKCFLVYSALGCGRALIDGSWVHMPQGSVLYLPAKSDVVYEPIDENQWSTYYITFSGKFSESMLELEGCVIDGDHSYIADTVELLKQKYTHEDFYEYSNSLIYFILLRLRRLTYDAKSMAVSNRATPQRIPLSLKYISEHFTEDLSVADLALACELSEEHYCRLFKKYSGMSPTAYIISLRISRACDLLLKYPDQKIADIGLQCGFTNVSYFNRMFKREIKITPREFRSQRLKNT